MSGHSAEKDAHAHEWEVEYLPDPMSGGGVVRSGDLRCRCGETTRDIPPVETDTAS